MTPCRGILIFGANGAGKTTLGKELARTLRYKHIDVEDYYFPPSEMPYTVSRTKDEVIKLMAEDIKIPWRTNRMLLDKLDNHESRVWYAHRTIENGWSSTAQ